MKPGQAQEWVEIIKETVEWFTPRAVRIYTSELGPRYGTVAAEVEFESLSDYEEFWAEMVTKPEYAAVMEKFNELIEDGTTHIWWLVE
jgi:hypothetical protein